MKSETGSKTDRVAIERWLRGVRRHARKVAEEDAAAGMLHRASTRYATMPDAWRAGFADRARELSPGWTWEE
jgi:hypothetical protein